MDTDAEIRALKQQVAKLQKQVIDLQNALVRESRNTTGHLKILHRHIVDINNYLWPLVGKVFPNYGKDLKAIRRIVKLEGSEGADE